MASYTVFDEDLDDDKIIQGDARGVLERIRAAGARTNDEIAKMDTDQYADALIEDAEYFLPLDLLDALKKQPFDSVHDRALAYLSQMATSGVRILSTR